MTGTQLQEMATSYAYSFISEIEFDAKKGEVYTIYLIPYSSI